MPIEGLFCIGNVQELAQVVVVMAVRNGARYLEAQLDSIAAQTAVDWSLVVSDDGSTDSSREICKAFGTRFPAGKVSVVDGPCQGAAENFRTLLALVSNAGLPVALCDQDDVWLPNHLARALSAVSATNSVRPVLYGGRTLICTADLRPIAISAPTRHPLNFSNALIQNVISGHTMVLNEAAVRLMVEADKLVNKIVIHDWWIYQVITGCGGTVIFDDQPTVFYRQHGENQIGANSGMIASLRRFKGMLAGEQQAWNAATLSALTNIRHLLTRDAVEKLETLASVRSAPLVGRLSLIRKAGVRRQSRLAQLSFLLAVVLGKI